MKYIRTKDGRIGKFYQEQSFTITCSLGCIDKDNILNQADTIEELCDEFVMLRLKDEMNDNEPIIFKHLDLAKSYFEKYLGYAIYGAIWTDKGLVYVAKMNKEGELELLWNTVKNL